MKTIPARGWVRLAAALVAGVLGVGGTPEAGAETTVVVECAKGKTIVEALERGEGEKPLVVIVQGTCSENITVLRDDVTIQGDPVMGGAVVGTDPARSTIVAQGARRAVIDRLTVSGARNGVLAMEGASVTVRAAVLQGNARSGLVAIQGGAATVDSTQVVGNGTAGIVVGDNSTGIVTNSTIQGNGGAGIDVSGASSVRVGLTIAGVSAPNTIQSNSRSGVSITQASRGLVDGNLIASNGGDGVYVDGGYAVVTNNTIRSNAIKGIEVTNAGSARIGLTGGSVPGPNTIELNGYEGIQITNGAAAFIYGNVIQSNGFSGGRVGVGIYRATGRLVGDNTIQGNATHGVEVRQSALFQGQGDFFTLSPGPDVIQGHAAGSGIRAFQSASLDLRKATVTGNGQHGIVLDTGSTLAIFGSTVSANTQHGVLLRLGSAAVFQSPPASVTANGGYGVSCTDAESSLAGNTSGVAGNSAGELNCTGF